MEKQALEIKPPPTPNRDKHPFVGTANVQGLIIDIENLAGSVREGKGPDGKPWRTKMRYHYGEIRKTGAPDGDKLDVYIGPNPHSKKVFIVHQNHPGGHPKAGQYDEDKVMLGFNSAEEAKRAYLKQYDRKDFFRSITEMNIAQFKKSIFGENKGEKVAQVLPNEVIQRMPMMSPEERAREFYTRGGAFLSSAGDEKEFERQQRAREATWAADPELQKKWRAFMEQYPEWYPRTAPGTATVATKEAACKTPGMKIRSKEKKHGLTRGNGRGPIGRPIGDTISNRLRRFAKTRKKDKRPSAFIRERMKVGGIADAYTAGVKIALAQALGLPSPPVVGNNRNLSGNVGALPSQQPSPPGGKLKAPSLAKGAPPPATSGASDGALS